MKPKHLPRLWCAMQGLLPLGLKSMKNVAPCVATRAMAAPKKAHPPGARSKRPRNS